MITSDIILSFIISYAAGKLQDYLQPDQEKILEKCYDKALDQWSNNESIKYSKRLGFHRHLAQLSDIIKHSDKEIDPNDKELAILFVNELHKDKDACYIIQNIQIDETLKLSKEIVTELRQMDDNQNRLLANSEEIKVALQKNTESIQLLSKKFNGIDIKCDDTIELICPIPHNVAERTDFIKKLKKTLDQDYAIHVFGGWRDGKSVTSCLLAQLYEGYSKILIPLSANSQVSLSPLNIIAKEVGKKIIILDGMKVDDPDSCISLCSIINKLKSENTLFIINSYESFAKVCMSGKSSIMEFEIPMLTKDDIVSMLDIDHKTWGELIYGISSGHPQLVQLAVNYVMSDNFDCTNDSLTNLFTFRGEMDIAVRCRTALERMVTKVDALELLNRLLLFEGAFSEEDCKTVAEVDPPIKVPMTLLSSLTGTWIQHKDGLYQVSPLLKKTLKPDLNTYVNKGCCDRIASIIIDRGCLSITDAMNVFMLYIKGGLYEDAAALYVQILQLLSDKALLETRGATLFKGIWHNIQLPKDMSDDIKVIIRLAQITYLGMKEPSQYDYSAEELEQLLDSLDVDKRKELSNGYIALTIYYLISGDIIKSNNVKKKAILSEETKEFEIMFDSKQLQLFQFYSVKSLDNLKAIMDKQSSEDFIPYDLYFNGCSCSIKNVIRNLSIEKKACTIQYIINYAYNNIEKLYPFAVYCIVCLIEDFSEKDEIDKCKQLFETHKDLLAYNYGRLMLNFSMAVSYEYANQIEKAEYYFGEASAVTDLSINPYVSLISHISFAKYIGNRDVNKSLDLMANFMKYNGFGTYLTEEQRMYYFGSLSIAYWFSGRRDDAVKMSNIVMDSIYKHKDNPSDAYKELAIRHGAMLTQYLSLSTNGMENENYLSLCYDMYFKNLKDILGLYSHSKIFGCLAITSIINDLIIKDDDLTYMYVKKGLEYCKVYNKDSDMPMHIMASMIPLMLTMNDIDGVEYLMGISAESLKYKGDKPTDIEISNLSLCLLQIACYRIMAFEKGLYFSDSRVHKFICDYLNRIGKNELIDDYSYCIKEGPIDYKIIEDDYRKIIALIWHLNDCSASNVLTVLYRVFSLWSLNWKQHSLISSLNSYFEAVLMNKIKNERQAFNLKYSSVDNLLINAKRSEGYESSKKIAIAYCYLLKEIPSMNKEMEAFFEL